MRIFFLLPLFLFCSHRNDGARQVKSLTPTDLYGKNDARRGRKMGHVTVIAEKADDAKGIALEIADVLGIEHW